MTNDLVYRFPRNENEDLGFSVREYKDRLYGDIRVYFKAGDGEWHPTKKGVTFAIELLPELQKGVSKLSGFCPAQGVCQ